MNAIKNALALCVVLLATSAPSHAQSQAGFSANEIGQLNGMQILGNMYGNALFKVGQLPNGQLVTIAPSGRLTVLPPGYSSRGLVIPNTAPAMVAGGNLTGGMMNPMTAQMGGMIQPGVRAMAFPAYPLAANPGSIPLMSHTYARLMPRQAVAQKKSVKRVMVRACR